MSIVVQISLVTRRNNSLVGEDTQTEQHFSTRLVHVGGVGRLFSCVHEIQTGFSINLENRIGNSVLCTSTNMNAKSKTTAATV